MKIFKICSLTIAPSSEAAQGAIASVTTLVDRPLVQINTAPITDFSLTRNEALEFAADRGYDWALMLDTDERIICDHPEMTRARLEEPGIGDVLMVPHISGTYEKERLFRLPARGHYHGPTHEAWITDDGAVRQTIRFFSFDELAKTPDQYRAKVERDRAILEQWTREHPDDPRWFYYLADSYSGLGMVEEAIAEFSRCWLLDGWDEESAWACYRAAELRVGLRQFQEAIAWCLRGMERRPDFSEFPWLIGWCEYQCGRYEKAIVWERLAITLSEPPSWAHPVRIGFRHPPAHFEGPWDVLAHATHALGNETVARTMRSMADKRQIQRGQDRSPAPE